MRRLLSTLFIFLIMAFLIKALYGPAPAKKPAVVSNPAVPEEAPAPVMSYKIPDTTFLSEYNSEDERARQKVSAAAGVALGLPTKAAYSPDIAVPSKEEVAEEIAMREKQRKDTEDKLARKESGLTTNTPFAFEATDTVAKSSVVTAKDTKTARLTVEGVQASDRRPIVFHH